MSDPLETFRRPDDAMSQSGVSASGTSSRGGNPSNSQGALQGRIDWIEEDINITRRRLRDTFGRSAGQNASGEPLLAIATWLERELVDEASWRQNLEVQVSSIEATLREERETRAQALRMLAGQLDESMKEFEGRVGNGLSTEANVMSTRVRKTELALQSLISRVEGGIRSGSQALRATLDTAKALEESQQQQQHQQQQLEMMRGLHQQHSRPLATRELLDAAVTRLGSSLGPNTHSKNEQGVVDAVGKRSVSPSIGSQDWQSGSVAPSIGIYAMPASLAGASRAVAGNIKAGANAELPSDIGKVWAELQEENERLRKTQMQLQEVATKGSRAPSRRSPQRMTSPGPSPGPSPHAEALQGRTQPTPMPVSHAATSSVASRPSPQLQPRSGLGLNRDPSFGSLVDTSDALVSTSFSMSQSQASIGDPPVLSHVPSLAGKFPASPRPVRLSAGTAGVGPRAAPSRVAAPLPSRATPMSVQAQHHMPQHTLGEQRRLVLQPKRGAGPHF